MKYLPILALSLLASGLAAQSVVNGYTATSVAGTLANARAAAFAPDGRLFFTEFGTGNIRVITTPTTTPMLEATPFATVSGLVSPGGNDAGLHGIAFDPNFATNHFVYVCHTTGTVGNPTLVVKRFTEDTMNPNTAVALSEVTVFGPVPLGPDSQRLGGRLAFGPDGKLYLTVGDGGAAVATAGAFAQSDSDNRGKVIRMNNDGTVPIDNPTGGSYVYAKGFRNPRGVAFNPLNNNLFVGDTGNPTTSGQSEINLLQAGGNFGWDANGLSGDRNDNNFVDPIWVMGSAVQPVAMAFYPNGLTQFPDAGHRSGALFVASEANSGTIFRVILNGQNQDTGIAEWPFAGSFPSNIRDLTFGPDGKMYVVTDTEIFVIEFTGNTSNDPSAVAGIDQIVDEGTLVTLDGSGSTDPDPDLLRYTWRQVGGSPDVTLTNPTSQMATFTAPGVSFSQQLTFELIVEDGNGGAHSDIIVVTVNNVPTPKKVRAKFDPPGEDGCSATGAGGGWVLGILAILAGVGLLRRRRV